MQTFRKILFGLETVPLSDYSADVPTATEEQR